MTHVRMHARVGSDGDLHLRLPGCRDMDVEVEVRSAPAGHTWREMSDDEWRDRARRLAGSIDDPSFLAPDDPPPVDEVEIP